MKELFISNSIDLFKYYKSLGDKTFAQVREEDFFVIPDEAGNSIAVIVQHLYGNMKSRWTDFKTSDGEKTWRDRDQEFELYLNTKEEVIEKWEEGWQVLFAALESIEEADFNKLVYIRNKGHHIIEAVQRQLGHYAYHVGQIVMIGRGLSHNWQSLSVPKGKSKEFNAKSFSKGKRKENFTEQFLHPDQAK